MKELWAQFARVPLFKSEEVGKQKAISPAGAANRVAIREGGDACSRSADRHEANGRGEIPRFAHHDVSLSEARPPRA